ncbi:hypothetical protein OUZ56_017257 [Daphnia magna]|nr:hypothetical protein OUZ56_017257 [Daphnia magna]
MYSTSDPDICRTSDGLPCVMWDRSYKSYTAIAMASRGNRAVGRTRGSTASRGRVRISVEPGEENLIEIVNEIPISHAQQQLLDEEREERDDEAIMDDAENNTTVSKATEPLPPPGNPIPIFTVQSWKSKWRRDFFTDWRWAEKKKCTGHQVWARCKTGKCQTNKKPHYYVGELTSFSNFEKHLSLCHSEEYSKYKKLKSVNDSSSSQATLHTFQQFRMTKDQQKKIDLDLGYAVAKDNIPINILQRPSFRQWIHSAVPGYKLPGIERMRYKIIPDIFHTTRDKLMKIIKESTSFTIILDIWSSKSMMGYIVLPAMPSPKHSSDTPSFLV